jgi:Rrf2 family iron-sulfur cluster assembly transcriptional regulator
MLDLALNQKHGPVTLAGISDRQMISQSYLEQLFSKLRRTGLVESIRGPGGGYSLASDPKSISVADIIHAVDETVDATQCAGKQNCRDHKRCMTHHLWSRLNDTIFNYLSSVSLADLMAEQEVVSVSMLGIHP